MHNYDTWYTWLMLATVLFFILLGIILKNVLISYQLHTCTILVYYKPCVGVHRRKKRSLLKVSNENLWTDKTHIKYVISSPYSKSIVHRQYNMTHSLMGKYVQINKHSCFIELKTEHDALDDAISLIQSNTCFTFTKADKDIPFNDETTERLIFNNAPIQKPGQKE